MKCEYPKKRSKDKRAWLPRGKVLIPPHIVFRSRKSYSRNREKNVKAYLSEY